MCFALFMIMLDNTVVNVALPSIQSDLDASLSALEWTVNIYTLTFAVLLVTGGRLGDIFGRRRAFLFGVVVFALSSATAGLAPNETWLVGKPRAPGHRRGVHDARHPVDHHQRLPRARARQGDRHVGRRLGAGARARPGGRRLPHRAGELARDLLPEPPGRRGGRVRRRCSRPGSRATPTVPRTVDFAGVATITVGIGALVLALVEGNGWGWGSPRILALLAASVAGLVAFVVVERRAKFPMVEFSFLRSRTFAGTNGIAFVVSFAMLAMFFFMALYMQNILGYSPLEAGIRFLPSTVHDHHGRADRRAAHGPHRRAHPDRRRAHAGGDRAVLAVAASTPAPRTPTSSPPSS